MGFRPSNGSHGTWFMAKTCDRCTHDHHWHDGTGGSDGASCDILMRSLLGEVVEEWDESGTCTGFAGPCPCEAVAS